jgi:hypothetical protein
MNSTNNLDVLERKILELRILTNVNWKNKEYEMAVMGEKLLRSINLARAFSESADDLLDKLPKSINELRDVKKLTELVEAATFDSSSINNGGI